MQKVQNYLVLGLGRSGIGAVTLLKNRGQNVRVYDRDGARAGELINAKIIPEDVSVCKKLGPKDFEHADYVILSPGIAIGKKLRKWIQKYNSTVYSEPELASRYCRADILAVTGTNGKTTTVEMLRDILKASDFTVHTVGNIGNSFCGEVDNIRPEDVAVCEISSFQLENIENFHPKGAAFLNFASDHLDRYSSLNEYFEAKARIFENMRGTDFAVLNFDDSKLRMLAKKINCRVYYFTLKSELPTQVNGVFLRDNKAVFTENGTEVELFSLENFRLLGKHNTENVMCAALLAYLYGVERARLQTVVSTLSAPEHRLEWCGCCNGADYYNDSKATNADSVLVAVNSFERPIVLLLGGSDKGEDHSLMFETMPKNVRAIVAFGAMGKKMYKFAKNHGFTNAYCEKSMDQAVKKAREIAVKNDIVLLSPGCASFDEFINFEERGELFKYLVREIGSEK